MVPPPASPSTLLRTHSRVGNSIFNVLGDGFGVAMRRDLGVLSNASGLAPFPERVNSPSQAALYAPIDDPYISPVCGAAPLLISRRTWYSSETARCCGFNRLTARMRAVCPVLMTASQPSCFPATLGISVVRTREKSQRVRSAPGRTVLRGMLGCLRMPYQPHRRTGTYSRTTHFSREKTRNSRCNMDCAQNTLQGGRKIVTLWLVGNRRWSTRNILHPDSIFYVPPVVIHEIGGRDNDT